jgi:hypothetical protein
MLAWDLRVPLATNKLLENLSDLSKSKRPLSDQLHGFSSSSLDMKMDLLSPNN